jgi:hypothetical protein
MIRAAKSTLQPRLSSGGMVKPSGKGVWRLEIPPGDGAEYRLAQVEDYKGLPRREFPWRPPARLSLRARSSHPEIPGTWGFGLWNDPFALSLGFGGASRALPALPNAAWFFFASPPNYLALRDDIPARGQLVGTFRSPHIPAPLLAPAVVALPLAFLPAGARLLRKIGRRILLQEADSLSLDTTMWHSYALDWNDDEVVFHVDGETIFKTPLIPLGPLGLVIWVDNQYAGLPPDGRLGYGNLPNDQFAWIDIEIDQDIQMPVKSQ